METCEACLAGNVLVGICEVLVGLERRVGVVGVAKAAAGWPPVSGGGDGGGAQVSSLLYVVGGFSVFPSKSWL